LGLSVPAKKLVRLFLVIRTSRWVRSFVSFKDYQRWLEEGMELEELDFSSSNFWTMS